MSTLLLRLEGPLQSWGIQSHFARRDAGLEPSKSGVIGLLCAALGRTRDADLSDLAAMRMGVRVDRPGMVQSDYHTVGGNRSADESSYGVATFDGSKRRTAITTRFYLADASFLVGFEASTPSQEALLQQLSVALARPVWPLFLGRKAFVPAVPIRLPDGLRPQPLEDALGSYPWLMARAGEQARRVPTRVRLVIEDGQSVTGESRMDVPISFLPLDRRYRARFVRTTFIDQPSDTAITGSDNGLDIEEEE